LIYVLGQYLTPHTSACTTDVIIKFVWAVIPHLPQPIRLSSLWSFEHCATASEQQGERETLQIELYALVEQQKTAVEDDEITQKKSSVAESENL
jgi:hypothetical protein